MARLFTGDFDFNSLTADHEFTSLVGSPTILSTGARTGTYRGRITTPTANSERSFQYQFKSANNTGSFYARGYLRVDTLPNVATAILSFIDSTGNTPAGISLNTDGTLKLSDNAGSQVGSNSAALSVGSGTYYRLEINMNTAGTVLEAKLDGTVFATTAVADLGGAGATKIAWGANIGGFDACNTLDIGWDDLAINDTSGSAQTGYPGSGKVLRLKPSAAGDVNTFATQTGGTAGAANNFTRVNEVTPDDATTFNGSSTLNQEDLFNMDDSGMGASDTVTLVQVTGRYRNSTADTTAALRFEIEKAAAGTKSQSASIVPNSTTWRTNANAVPKLAPITLYLDPDGAAWTQTTVDSMQVGYKMQVGPGTAGRRIDVTSVSAIVEYVPAAGGGTAWTKSLSDSVTASEAIVKTPTLNKSDSVTSSEAIAKTPRLNKSDSATSSEAIAKTPQPNKSDSVTSSDASVRTPTLNRSDSVTSSEAHRSTPTLNKSDSVTSSDSSTRTPTKGLSDSVTSSDSRATTLTKVLADSATAAEVIHNTLTKNFSDSVSTSDSSTRAMALVRGETVSVADAVAKLTGKALEDTANLTDAMAKALTKSLDDSAATADHLIAGKVINLSLSDSVSAGDNSTRAITKGISDSVSAADIVAKTFAVFIADTVGATDSEANTLTKMLQDGASVADAITKSMAKYLSDDLTAADLVDYSFPIFASLSDVVVVSDQIRIYVNGQRIAWYRREDTTFEQAAAGPWFDKDPKSSVQSANAGWYTKNQGSFEQ